MSIRLPLALAAVSAVALAACQPVPGQGTQNTQQGAAIGAGLGALAGAITADDSDDRLENALAGAAIGGAVGAGVGYNMDRQAAELRASLGQNVGVVNTGNQLVVTMPNDILFATDSTALNATLQNDLRTVAASLNRYPQTRVNVIGHTDSQGAAAYNMDLSQRRAQAVANVLVSAGVASSRIAAIGRGEDQPIASNQTAAGMAQNRRVEIVITPMQ